MKVNIHTEDNKVFKFSFHEQEGDVSEGGGQGSMKVGYCSNVFTFTSPVILEKMPHPDLIGLLALVSVKPWIGTKLELDTGVSLEFHEMVKKLFNISVVPVNESVLPRKKGNTPILSYSGGIDSVAASEIFPSTIPYVYFERCDHPDLPNKAEHVQVQAITNIIKETANLGRNVYRVASDLEHICKPYPTLPHWFAISAGILLMADYLDGGMIIMGGTLETFFMDMGKSWKGAGGKGLDPLADLVGLPICRPMLGVTEIATMKIAHSSVLGKIARSCVLGSLLEPCGQCVKCVRKIMTEAVITGDSQILDKLNYLNENSVGIRSIINADPPYYMQAQLEYCLSRVEFRNNILDLIYHKVGLPESDKTTWMEKYYSPAIEFSSPIEWRGLILYELNKKLTFMRESDIDFAMNYGK